MEDMVQIAMMIAVKQGHHAPMLFLDGTIAKAPMMLEDVPDEHEEKVLYLYHAGKCFSKKHEIGKLNKVFLIWEAWMGTNITIRPSTDPKRIEVLLIGCLDVLTNKQTMEMLEYVRDPKGNLIELKQLPLPKDSSVESPLLPAFVAGYNLAV
jgi:hypothetical protein